MNSNLSAFNFFLGWTVFLGVLYAFAQIEWGKRITYYTLWLMIVFLIVTHYAEINTIIQAAIPEQVVSGGVKTGSSGPPDNQATSGVRFAV